MAKLFRRGISEVWFTTLLSSTTSPSIAQIEGASGEDLTAAIADITGFEFDNSPIPTPKLSSTFTTTIPGEDVVSNPSVELYDDDTSSVLRTAMAKGTTGWIVLSPYGQTTTERAEVWPATTTGVNDLWTVGNEAARFRVGFAITAVPNQNAVLAA